MFIFGGIVVSLNKTKESNIYSVDFHVHSPASSCYQRNGKGEHDAYIDFLKKVEISGLDIVFITDHNSIKGYKEIINIMKNSEDKINTYKQVKEEMGSLSEKLNNDYEQYSELKSIFDKVDFFPGVEFTTQDQIHMLVIFDRSVNLELIEQFLFNGGYGPDKQGVEETDVLAKWNVISLLEEVDKSFGDKALVIGAHVDRDKGIWKLDKGLYKAAVFNSSRLNGYCYNSPITKEAITKVLQNKEYNRKGIQLVPLHSSDFHNVVDEQIGVPCSFLKLNRVRFNNIIDAFSNPDELVSSPVPKETIQIITELVNDINNTCVADLSDENLEIIKKAFCAYSNSCSGNILIGVDQNRKLVGINISDEEIKQVNLDLNESIYPLSKVKHEIYSFGKRKIISYRINKGQAKFYTYQGKCFILKDNVTVEATIEQVAQQVEKAVYEQFNDILDINRKRLKRITDLVEGYSDGLEVMQYLKNIEEANTGEYLGEITDIDVIINETDLNIELPKACVVANGNAIILGNVKPRTESYIAGFTPTARKVPESELEKYGLEKFSGEKIIISATGVAYYDNRSDITILNDRAPLILTVKDKYKDNFSEKIICAYLKSLPLLYYVYLKKDSINIYPPSILLNIKIPYVTPEKREEIERLVDRMVEMDLKLQSELEPVCDSCSNKNPGKRKCRELIKATREAVQEVMKEVDKLFFAILGIDECKASDISKRANVFLEENL